MYALLKEAGIRSVYTVIKAGEDPNYLLTDLPSSQFNHVILFVPMGKDTTWLECTSQTSAAGYLGGFTGNRYAVAVDENGGTIVKTPHYGIKENLQVRKITAIVNDDGYLNAHVKTDYSAVQQDRLHSLINGLSKDKLMEFLKEDLELATYDVKNYDYKELKRPVPVVAETLDVVAESYATVSGKRFFIVPNIFTRTHRKLKVAENRKYDEIIFMTPDGSRMDQRTANQLSLKENLLIICGHYKGIDERIRQLYVTREISIGDYVLSGGELAAAVLVDAVGRLIPGVLNDETSALTDSFQDNLLAPPVYTRPADFRGHKVPDILMSGDPKKVDEWRHEQSMQRTRERRPDLLDE